MKRINNKFLNKSVSILVSLMLLITLVVPLIVSMDSQAMTPRVMLSEYSLSADEIYPGDSFTVNFKLKNTSKNQIMNLKCTVSSDNGEFIPVDSTGSVYVAEIKGEEEVELSMDLTAIKKLSEKSYKLTIKTEYEDWNGKYNASDVIYIPVKLKTEVLISETYIAEEEIRLGDNIEIVSTINNIGGADIYKVQAKCSGDNIADANCYVGNIAPGKQGNIDIITKATAVSTTSTYDNLIDITYEDIDGNEYKETVYLGNEGRIEVLEQDYSDIIKVKEDTSTGMTNNFKLLIVLGCVVVLVLFFVIKRFLKRRRLEKEFD